jgi:hypothetical protein
MKTKNRNILIQKSSFTDSKNKLDAHSSRKECLAYFKKMRSNSVQEFAVDSPYGLGAEEQEKLANISKRYGVES